MTDGGNGGWGHGPDSGPKRNTLYVYRTDGASEKAFVGYVNGATHEGRLFLHDLCTGNRVSYKVSHVNQLLTGEEDRENIKERIVSLIPRLNADQLQWLADGINEQALEVVRGIDANVAMTLENTRVDIPHVRTSAMVR